MADATPGNIPPRYNMNEVYKSAFGYVRPPYPALMLEGETLGLSPVGTIKALRGSFKLRSALNVEYTLPIKLDNWQLPQEPVVGIRGGKNIIETELNRGEINGRKLVQNVLEEINLNNYQVRIRGIILNEEDPDAYPEDAVRRLREICEKPGSISIENGLTALWNITRVAIRDWDLREVQGYVGAQAFELDCISDVDFELEVIDAPERL